MNAWRRSLRTQLVVWNILTLALLLGALGLIIRYTVQTTIMASVNREMDGHVRQMVEHGPPPNGPPPGPPPDFNGDTDQPPPNDMGQYAPGPPGDHPPPGDRDPNRPRRFDLSGRPLEPFHSADTPWDPNALRLAALGEPVYSDTKVDGVPYRILSRVFPPNGPAQGVVQAAYPLTDVRRALAGVNSALLILIPVALLCAGLGGAALTDRVLRRVRRMTVAAGQIGAQDFSERLPVSGQDEFAELATTFNGMLGRLEAAFQQQRRLVEQQRRFTADASHELKTPLTIIKGNTSMALSTRPGEDDYRQSMQEIDRAAETMGKLVRDLLLLARSDSGQLGRATVELLVQEILERAISGVTKRSASPICLQMSDASLSVMGNEDELIRLFSNLIDNAVRHTPPDGQITVAARATGDQVEVTVADTGIGIAPEHLPHLGERFYRIDSARARQDGGTGLGLSICRSIVEAHGGNMTFTSAPGVGTSVRVTLPGTDQEETPGLT